METISPKGRLAGREKSGKTPTGSREKVRKTAIKVVFTCLFRSFLAFLAGRARLIIFNVPVGQASCYPSLAAKTKTRRGWGTPDHFQCS
jgi:hypothetical protein